MNRLKELRLAHGYKSQKDLAEVLFVNQTAVSQWERGVTTPSSQMLLKLSDMYGVSVDYLLGLENQKEKAPALGGERKPKKEELMAAFWGGDKDLSPEDMDAMWRDVENFAAFVAQKKKEEKRQ
ncbi:MAG: helix-turn-helix domain-containing protein [Ruminococcus flavefaciens]|nr:helix-turn-helix domain-containing protein [Ruminococcus flavefaciens]